MRTKKAAPVFSGAAFLRALSPRCARDPQNFHTRKSICEPAKLLSGAEAPGVFNTFMAIRHLQDEMKGIKNAISELKPYIEYIGKRLAPKHGKKNAAHQKRNQMRENKLKKLKKPRPPVLAPEFRPTKFGNRTGSENNVPKTLRQNTAKLQNNPVRQGVPYIPRNPAASPGKIIVPKIGL